MFQIKLNTILLCILFPLHFSTYVLDALNYLIMIITHIIPIATDVQSLVSVMYSSLFIYLFFQVALTILFAFSVIYDLAKITGVIISGKIINICIN